MLCERCKIREANIKYTEVINGVKTEHNLCSQCAKEIDFGQYSAIFDGDFPLGKLFSGLLGFEASPKREKMQQVVCPTCGLSYEEFTKSSQFGCADCYSVFGLLIGDNIKQLQGSDKHIGKKPRYQREEKNPEVVEGRTDAAGQLPVEERIDILDRKLKEALKNEEYEQAASCRDQIRALREERETNA